MEYTTLGSTGIEVSRICLGCCGSMTRYTLLKLAGLLRHT